MSNIVRTISLRPRMARAFVDYNPFYLLSAMCMLAGLFSLNDSLDWSPIPQNNLLYLIGVLNVYEGLLISLGIFLVRRELFRDATTLFILEAFFLVDAGFLSAEVFTADLSLGLWINAFLFVLAAIKLAAVFHGLGLSLSDGRFRLILCQLFILLAMPGIFKFLSMRNDATLSPLALFAFWWVVGFIPVLYLLLVRNHEDMTHRRLVGTFLVLSFISILAHLCTSNWVYHVRWYSANISPLLLGLATAIGASDWHVRTLSLRIRIQLLLPIMAIMFAWDYRYLLNFEIGGVALSPLRLVLIGAALVYLHGLIIHRHPYFVMACLLFCGGAALGDSPGAMSRNLYALIIAYANRAWSWVPKTVTGWGVVSVAASFVLLGLGTLLSLLKPSELTEEDVVYAAATPDDS